MLALLVLVVAFLVVVQGLKQQQNLPRIWQATDGEDKGVGAGYDVVDDLKQKPWIFKYTYDQGKTMQLGNQQYVLPDGIAGMTVRKAYAFNETRLSNTWSDYYTYAFKTTSISLAASINVNSKDPKNPQNVELGLAFTKTKGYISQLTKNGTRSFGYNGAVFLTFGLQFRGMRRPAFDDDFAYDLNHLPTAYNAATYRRFLTTWGTHYFTNARYGCEYNVTVSVDKKFQEQRSVQWATSQLDLTIKYKENQLGIKTEKHVNKSSIDGSFLDGAQVQANARGGDELLFTAKGDFDNWVLSCGTIKAVIVKYSEVEPITEVIDNAIIKANVLRAIIDYGNGRLKK